jgi:aldose 1-epimerase
MDILPTELKLYCSSYVEVDDALIPTGNILPAKNTPLDFNIRKPIGRDIGELASKSIGGYDHCFVIDGETGKLRPCAEVYEPFSGRTMRIFTTQPGVQLYTGNYISAVQGKIGSVYEKYGAFCLETQHYPDSPNQSGFPSTIFGPGQDYQERAVFAFDW